MELEIVLLIQKDIEADRISYSFEYVKPKRFHVMSQLPSLPSTEFETDI